MAIVSAKEMLLNATSGSYAVGAFNVTNLVEMKAVIAAAVEKKSPVIVQTSVSPSKFFSPEVIAAACRVFAAASPVPVCLHLDHSTDTGFCMRCADAGYTNIMIDASKNAFEENIRLTRLVSDYCHGIGDISVEGELGTVSGVEDQVKVAESDAALCNPEDVMAFVEQTGVDIFAPAIGTAHGVYKTKNPVIDFDRLKQIGKLLNGEKPTVPIVVHGGTGLSPDTVKKLVVCGCAKFNVSTDLKHALIDTTCDYISAHRDEYNPGAVDAAVFQAIKDRVAYWIGLLGCGDKA